MTPIKLSCVDEQTPVGTVVLVAEDNQTITRTATRSEPWRLGHGELVVSLVGRSGGYRASRCFLEGERP